MNVFHMIGIVGAEHFYARRGRMTEDSRFCFVLLLHACVTIHFGKGKCLTSSHDCWFVCTAEEK